MILTDVQASQMTDAWFKKSVTGVIRCPFASCNLNFTEWIDLLDHARQPLGGQDGKRHESLRHFLETKTCRCGHKEEDYESLFAHMEVEANEEFKSRDLAERQVSIAAPAGPDQLLATDVAETSRRSPTSSLSIPSNEQSFFPAHQNSRLLPPSLPYMFIHSPQSHATDHRMAHCEPPMDEKPLNTARIVRPYGSTKVFDWSNDTVVQALIEGLNSTGWILIKGRALQWKDLTIDQQQFTGFRVTGASPVLKLPMLKLS